MHSGTVATLIKVLRKDHQYLLDILKAMKSETCKEDLVVRDSGHLSHSSWLKKANRYLRLFISEESPSPKLQKKSFIYTEITHTSVV